MPDLNNINLVSSEIAGLWDSYMGDSLAIRVLSYFLNNVEDSEVRALLQHTLDLSNQHISIVTGIFNKEGLPIPQGFTDRDVNVNAPRLYTDTLYAAYISSTARIGMYHHSLILNQVARADIRDYFSKCIAEYIDLYNKSAELRLSKGTFIRAPHINVPKEVQFVESQSFISNILGEKRPLLAREIMHIFRIVLTNMMGNALITGFSQVSPSNKISSYFSKGCHLSVELITELTDIIKKEGIPVPATSEVYVTDSTESPFSEKLMLTVVMMMASMGVSGKGMAMADSVRGDLQVMYTKLIATIMKYAKDGIDIMIENKWLEQPPQAIKHKNLVKV